MSKQTSIELYQQPPIHPEVMEVSTRWIAARMLLEQPALAGRTDSFCDEQSETIDSEVLNESWSSGQRKLIEIAMSLIDPDHKVSLCDVFDGLGSRYSKAVLDVLSVAMSSITIEILPDKSPTGAHAFIQPRSA